MSSSVSLQSLHVAVKAYYAQLLSIEAYFNSYEALQVQLCVV